MNPILLGIATLGQLRAGFLDLLKVGPIVQLGLFPQQLDGLSLVLAIPQSMIGTSCEIRMFPQYDPAQIAALRLSVPEGGSVDAPSDKLKVALDPNLQPLRAEAMLNQVLYFLGCSGSSHLLGVLPVPTLILTKPTRVVIECVRDATTTLGSIDFQFVTEPDLTKEERRALSAQPASPKCYIFNFGCSGCSKFVRFHAPLIATTIPKGLPSDSIDVAFVPDSWTCACGRTQLDLTFCKRAIPFLFRHHAIPRKLGINVSALTHAPAALEVARSFTKALDEATVEEDIQVFIQDNPLVWHFLGPVEIHHKPPVLASKVADFAIVTAHRTLVLVELEHPKLTLLTKQNGLRAEIQKPITQITDWREKLEKHRAATIEEMKLRHPDIQKIRYMIVAGRGRDGADRVRSMVRDDTDFFTFDELGGHLLALHSQLAQL